MIIAPRIRLLSWLLKLRKPTYKLSLPEIKQKNEETLGRLLTWIFLGSKVSLPKIVNRTVSGRHGDIPIRLYYPSADTNLPLIIFFHGGGWVTGSLETHDRLCRRIAQAANALIVAVDYRLAPWHKYPIPLEDCYDTTVWASSQAKSLGANPNQLMVMGDSAGGNIAAAVCLMSRDLNGPKIIRQTLIYPAVDGTLSYPSHQRYANAPLLSQTSIHFFRAQYMNTSSDIQKAYFSPLLAENLKKLPPAFILTAEYDPLHDEAKAFAQKLSEAGNTAIYKDYPGMVHAFLVFPRFCSGATVAVNDIGQDIQNAITSISP